MTAVVPIFPTSAIKKSFGKELRSMRYEDDDKTNVTRLIKEKGWRIEVEEGSGPQ